jgi:pimeloyl-ACP methyl ester carboxylesterase
MVLAPDLPGHGDDGMPTNEVTLDRYVERVRMMLDEAGQPAILLGHSMGGVVISQAAERFPEQVKRLVYLTAFIPSNGETLLQLAESDPSGKVLPNLEFAEDGASATVREDMIKTAFYHDCDDADVERAKKLLVPQAAAPFATPVETSEANWGRLPRAYIECTEDQAIPIALQRRMLKTHPCDPVFTMETSHSPFFSAPEKLAEHLLSLAD